MHKFKASVMLFFVLIFAFSMSKVYAVSGQWSSNGSNIFYNDGRIGIGTANPADQLQVVNSTTPDASGFPTTKVLFGDTTDSFWFYNYKNSNGDGWARILVNGYYDGQWKKRNANKSSWLTQYTSTGSSSVYHIAYSPETQGTVMNWKDMFLIKADGRVYVNSLIVKNASSVWWGDYVFNKDYKLKPLNEVEAYISENQHLPDIPSAKEIENEGLSVSDMQAKQMVKIEELTLYILQQDKRIEQLEKTVSELKK